MADLSITATSVVKGSNAVVGTGTAGATITAGQSIYIDSSDSDKVKLADANASSATATCRGIALHGASADQPIDYIISGSLTMGAILTQGRVYVVSATAGGIAPVSDLTTGWYTTTLGVATSTSVLDVRIHNSGAVN